MITLSDYLGKWDTHPDVTDEIIENAEKFLFKVNQLLDIAFAAGVDSHINPATGTYISGKTLGGFRPKDTMQGSPKSSHKQGRGVDIYDPDNELDDWCKKHQDVLHRLGLYMEHPDATNRWCHLTDRAPKSGKVIFMP